MIGLQRGTDYFATYQPTAALPASTAGMQGACALFLSVYLLQKACAALKWHVVTCSHVAVLPACVQRCDGAIGYRQCLRLCMRSRPAERLRSREQAQAERTAAGCPHQQPALAIWVR